MFPNKNGVATGTLYLDDMLTLKNEEKGEFLFIQITWTLGKWGVKVVYNNFMENSKKLFDEKKGFEKQNFFNSVTVHE